jgi:hypothetical protein
MLGKTDMPTPQFELDELNEILHGENIELLRSTLTFAVAECIVKYNDTDLLKQFPPWVEGMVGEMCEMYRQRGRYGIISNLGEADHSEMVGRLAELLKPIV